MSGHRGVVLVPHNRAYISGLCHRAGKLGPDPLGDWWAQSPNVRLALLVPLFRGHFGGAESKREATGMVWASAKWLCFSKPIQLRVVVVVVFNMVQMFC